ncbi:hypothetical protein Tco_0866286 [Tanacetum coccineum]
MGMILSQMDVRDRIDDIKTGWDGKYYPSISPSHAIPNWVAVIPSQLFTMSAICHALDVMKLPYIRSWEAHNLLVA